MDKVRQQKIGLYDPKNEHDACGIGFVANIKGVGSHSIVNDGLEMLENLEHRGAVGSDKSVGDGAGILTQIPDEYFRKELLKEPIYLENGYVNVSDKPGLGIEVNFEIVKKYKTN